MQYSTSNPLHSLSAAGSGQRESHSFRFSRDATSWMIDDASHLKDGKNPAMRDPPVIPFVPGDPWIIWPYLVSIIWLSV
jgi:hypothetical protein